MITLTARRSDAGRSIRCVHETVASLIEHFDLTPLPVEATFFVRHLAQRDP